MEHEHTQAKHRAAIFSVLAALGLTLLKLVVGLYTNSLGILSEALHSGLDLLAALMTLYAVRVSSRPADSGHPYGHGKVENLSALAETLLLFLISFWVIYEGIQRLLGGGELPSWAEMVRPNRPAERLTGRQLADSVLERLAKLGGDED